MIVDLRRNSLLVTRHYPDLGSDASSVRNFYARSSDVISWGETGGVFAKCRLSSKAITLEVKKSKQTSK